MKNVFNRIMGIDEMKISVLVVMFLFAMAVGAYSVFSYGDIPTNLTSIIICIILSISGLNALVHFGKSNGSPTPNAEPEVPSTNETRADKPI